MATPTLASHNLAAAGTLEYNQLPWGDLIYGTKHQLRNIGIGVDAGFPGEAGCPKRRVTVSDPRGFRCQIERCDHLEEGIFSATIRFPGREQPQPEFRPFAPGVRRLENIWSDDYVGSGEALAAAGLIRLDQLPGQPGMRKAIVTILPDGSVPAGPKANDPSINDAGAKRVTRTSQTAYQVSVLVEPWERARRYEAYAQSRSDWEERMRDLPRPARLDAPLPILAIKKARIIPACRTVGNVVYLPGAYGIPGSGSGGPQWSNACARPRRRPRVDYPHGTIAATAGQGAQDGLGR